MTLHRHVRRLPRRSLGLLVAAAAALTPISRSAHARDGEPPAAMAVTDVIESCAGSAPIRFRDSDKRALLEAADSDAIAAAIVARYPMIEQDGNTPQGSVLWQQPEFGWVYVALRVDSVKPGTVCFTATFEAGKFEMTPELLDKYFGSGAAKKN